MTNSIFTQVYSEEQQGFEINEHMSVMCDHVQSMRNGTPYNLCGKRALIGDRLNNVLDIIYVDQTVCFADSYKSSEMLKILKNAKKLKNNGTFVTCFVISNCWTKNLISKDKEKGVLV